MTHEELLAWIRLSKTGASARRLNRLLDHFGSPQAFFDASAAEVQRLEQCPAAVAEKLLDPHHAARDRDLRLLGKYQTRLVPRTSPEYPALLKEIADPPPVLYVRGTLLPQDARAVAIVGSRQAGEYGLAVAARLGRELAEAGITVVSGLARGADTAAHTATVNAGGRTLACLGCGIDVCYPYDNRRLADRIAEQGAVLSEYPMNAPPDAWHFPSRNRIISGLSLGVVLVEAPKGSGALITVDCALDQNREVFAVPGNIDNPRNRGAHALIKDGARLVESVEDILSELRLDQPRGQLALDVEVPATPPRPALSPDEAALFELLGSEPKPVDDLILESGLPASRVNATLITLEIHGLARRVPGNAYLRLS